MKYKTFGDISEMKMLYKSFKENFILEKKFEAKI